VRSGRRGGGARVQGDDKNLKGTMGLQVGR